MFFSWSKLCIIHICYFCNCIIHISGKGKHHWKQTSLTVALLNPVPCGPLYFQHLSVSTTAKHVAPGASGNTPAPNLLCFLWSCITGILNLCSLSGGFFSSHCVLRFCQVGSVHLTVRWCASYFGSATVTELSAQPLEGCCHQHNLRCFITGGINVPITLSFLSPSPVPSIPASLRSVCVCNN